MCGELHWLDLADMMEPDGPEVDEAELLIPWGTASFIVA